MALTKKDEAAIQKHLDKFKESGIMERSHFQCPLVQEALKDKKPVLIGKVLVLGDHRIFFFEKSQPGQSSGDIKKGLAKASSLLSSKKDRPKGSNKQLSGDQEVEEVAYFDILSIEHNKTSKFTLKVKSWVSGGEVQSLAFRTDSTPQIVEKICHLRQKICGAFPALDLVGPEMTFSEALRPFKPECQTTHYSITYVAWCNYYAGMKPNFMCLPWVRWLEDKGKRDLDLTQAPGFSVVSDDNYNVGPLIFALAHDTYFRGLIIHDIQRRETFSEVAEVVRNNSTLAKIVLVNVDGDYTGAMALGAALNANTKDTLAILDLSENKIGGGTETLSAWIARYTGSLTYLNLANCQIPAKNLTELINALIKNERLSKLIEVIDLSFNKFDEETSTALGNWGAKYAEKAELKSLSVAGTQFNFNAIVKLKLLQKLHTLNIANNKIDQELQLQCLWHFFDINPSVIKFNIASTNYGASPLLDKGVEFLQLLWSKAARLPHLELNLSGNPAIADQLHKALLGAKNVTRLDISSIKVKEPQFIEIVKVIALMASLAALRMDDPFTSRMSASADVGSALVTLVRSSKIAELAISGGYGPAPIITFLVAMTKKNQFLMSLDISNNGIGDAGAEALAQFILQDKVLTSLKMDGNQIKHNGFNSICVALAFNDALKNIYWSSEDIEAAGRELPRGPKDQLYKVLQEISSRLKRPKMEVDAGYNFNFDAFGKDIPETPGKGSGDMRRKETVATFNPRAMAAAAAAATAEDIPAMSPKLLSTARPQFVMPSFGGDESTPRASTPVPGTPSRTDSSKGLKASTGTPAAERSTGSEGAVDATSPRSDGSGGSGDKEKQLATSPGGSASPSGPRFATSTGGGQSSVAKRILEGGARRQSDAPAPSPTPAPASPTTRPTHSGSLPPSPSILNTAQRLSIALPPPPPTATAPRTASPPPPAAEVLPPPVTVAPVQTEQTVPAEAGDGAAEDDEEPPFLNPFTLASLVLPNEEQFL